MRTRTNRQLTMHVARVTIVWNLILSVYKLIAGICAHSGAMLSDAVHSASDVFSTVIVMIGVRLAAKKPDQEHPYGHERMECVAALLLAGVLLATGIGIGYAGVRHIFGTNGNALPVPGRAAMVAAALSVAVKEAMYWYTRAAAKKTGSGALMADAWHHRSDALSSVGSFAGIFGARLGFPVLDPLASILICLLIGKAAVSIAREAIDKMTDHACDPAYSDALFREVARQAGVVGIDRLDTRLFGDRIYVDLEIRADAASTLCQAHEVAHRVHDAVEEHFPKVKHCMVHVNPDEPQ